MDSFFKMQICEAELLYYFLVSIIALAYYYNIP